MALDAEGLELRVLTGRHRGARCALPTDASEISVGRSSDSFVVLRDLPMPSGEIVIDGQVWSWKDADFQARMPLGGTLDLGGGVWLQVCSTRETWPSSPMSVADRVRPSEPVAEAEPASSDGDRETEEERQQTLGAPDVDPFVVASSSKPFSRRRGVFLQVGLAALLMAIAALWLWKIAPEPADRSSEQIVAADTVAPSIASVPPAKAEPPAQGQLAAVEAVINDKGLTGRVKARVNASDRIEIKGIMANDEEFEDFVRAVRKVSQRPVLRILTQRDFESDIRGIQQELSADIKIASQPIGILVVRGTVKDEAERVAVIERIKALSPLAVQVDPFLKTQDELAREMKDKKRSGAQSALPPPRPMAIMGGPEPFLIMQTGERILIGGLVGGFTLTAIADAYVEYRSADGKTVRTPR